MTNVYKTAQGRIVDMDKLMNQNELTLAVGNKKVNARGDKIGPGGQIIKNSYTGTPRVPDQMVSTSTPIPTPTPTPTPVIEEIPVIAPTNAKKTKDIADMDPEGNE
jgi:hypothetical protein